MYLYQWYTTYMDKKQQDIKSQVRFPFDVLEAIKQLAHQRSFNGEVIWALRQYIETQRQ